MGNLPINGNLPIEAKGISNIGWSNSKYRLQDLPVVGIATVFILASIICTYNHITAWIESATCYIEWALWVPVSIKDLKIRRRWCSNFRQVPGTRGTRANSSPVSDHPGGIWSQKLDGCYYRRSPYFVIFGTKRVSRNSGITNFETLFSAKSQIGSKDFLKSTFLANFSFLKSEKQ